WETLRNVWEAIYKWWDTEGADWLTDTVGTVWDYISKIPGKIGEKVGDLVENAKTWLAGAWNAIHDWWDTGGEQWLTDTVEKIWAWVQQIGGKIGEKALDLAMTAGSWLADVWTGMHSWWDTDGEQWVTDTVGKITTWLGNLLSSENVPDVVKDAVAWLEPIWMSTADWWDEQAGPLVDEMVKGFERWMSSEMVPALKNSDSSTWSDGVGEALASGIEQAIDYLYTPEVIGRISTAIASFIAKTFSDLMGLGPMIIVGFLEWLVTSLFDPESVPSFSVTRAWQWLEQLLGGALQGLIDGLQSGLLGQLISQFAQAVVDFLAGLFKGDESGGGTKTAAIAPVGESLVAGLWEGISSKANELKTNIQTFVTTNITKAVNWATSLIDAGHYVIQGLLNGLEDKKKDVIDWVGRLVGDIIDAV
ncbi:MAG: hypothetical protein KDI56_10410, partial [Xanthomonadales bacterium]|nr:hypothetical protein [Xanthomonadales bacterium]